ncbi:hypothetical protein SteCoe_12712 [Stentor coeruleus]|uniref:Uncharacterized protein n=1 Tax=Stentor coeruleus TaxID=5963 RepID=A0A1R2CA79_9CILI|nr:hypothetical protein SteCoe_12712 [Stentor coeruleus]
MESEEHQAKVVLIGDSGVGKSSLLDMFVMSTFKPNQESTVGGSFKSKEVHIGTKIIKLNIWDTAGQERYQSLTKMYCRGASVAILVYDITKKETFDNLRKWHEIVLESGNTDMIFAVVGNKEDLIEREEVKLEDARGFASKIGGFYRKTSARTGFGVESLFENVGYKLFPGEINSRQSSQKLEQISLSQQVPPSNKCCA